MDGILLWVRSYLTSAFLGGAEGRRRVMFPLFATLWPVTIVVGYVFSGGHHPTATLVRILGLGGVILWLLLRRRPSDVEWVVLWTIAVVGWLGTQYAVGPTYAGTFAVSAITIFMVVTVAFEPLIVGYVAVAGAVVYTIGQLHFHPAGRALLALLIFVIVEAIVVVVVGGTSGYLPESPAARLPASARTFGELVACQRRPWIGQGVRRRSLRRTTVREFARSPAADTVGDAACDSGRGEARDKDAVAGDMPIRMCRCLDERARDSHVGPDAPVVDGSTWSDATCPGKRTLGMAHGASLIAVGMRVASHGDHHSYGSTQRSCDGVGVA